MDKQKALEAAVGLLWATEDSWVPDHIIEDLGLPPHATWHQVTSRCREILLEHLMNTKKEG